MKLSIRGSHYSQVRQRGYLIMLAVLLIMVTGFMGTMLLYMLDMTATTTLGFQQSEKTLYIAEAGFEQTARRLLTPLLTGSNLRIGCASVTSNANLTNTTFGDGTFTATTVASNPIRANTTLSGAITSTATTIPLTSTTGFAASGRVMIDQEIMNYGAISGSNLIAVQRGVNANYNNSHSSGAYVSQFQCMVDIKAGIPNLTSPVYTREIHQAVSLQEAWAVGVVSGNNFIFTRWNYPTAVAWNSSPLTNSTTKTTLNGVSMISNAEGWAVGNVVAPNHTLLHWTGSAWSAFTLAYACSNQNLAAVSSVDSNEAWAVGVAYRPTGTCTTAGGTRRYTILKWNGTAWSALASPTIPADSTLTQNLSAVHVIDATQSGAGTIGFAVGIGGAILKYNGSTWVSDTSPTTNNLTGVFVVSASEAWAVGAAGTILKWNGSTWSTFTSPTATQLNGIQMIAATLGSTASNGWAVGNSGVAVYYNGSSWALQSIGGAQNYFGVGFFSTGTDAWAAGSAGTIMHWNGSAWAAVASNVTTQLNAISVIAPQQYPFSWQEIYP